MKSRFKGLLFLLFGAAVLGVCAWQGWAWWSWASAPVTAAESEADSTTEDTAPEVQIEIPPGTPGQQIGKDLETAGLIRSATAWDLWTRWQGISSRAGDFQAGVYELSPSQSMEEIANQIWQGDVLQTSFTVPEGWSIDQMAESFEEQGFFSAEEFKAATRQIPYDQYPWLPADLPHLEGFLYPDTYQLASDLVSPAAFVDQMLSRFEQVALPLYQDGQDQTNLSLLEWVTLASIVEKESVIADERSVIAGVFTNRLRDGMRLEADPTVEYALGIRQTVEQPLTFAQVETPSPYNTYVNTGLPPTAIASPGIAALEATLYPADTNYVYFVARYDGTHVFSETLDEHLAAQNAIRDAVEASSSQSSDSADNS